MRTRWRWWPAVVLGVGAFLFFCYGFADLYDDFFANSGIMANRIAPVAAQFLRTHSFTYPNGQPSFYPMWGYPFLVAVLDLATGASNHGGTKLLQAALSGGGVALLYLMLVETGIRRAWAALAAVAFALSISVSGFVGSGYDQQIMPPLAAITMFGLHRHFSDRGRRFRARWLIVAGVVLGLACNIRSELVWLPAFLLIALGLPSRDRRTLQGLVLLCGVVLVCLLPWAIRSRLLSGHTSITGSNVGAVMYISLGQGQGPNVWGIQHLDAAANQRLTELRPDLVADAFNSPEASALLMRDALSDIRAYPGAYAALVKGKFLSAFDVGREAEAANIPRRDLPAWGALSSLVSLLLLGGRLLAVALLACVLVAPLAKRRPPVTTLSVAAAIAAYVVLSQSLGQSLGRHLAAASFPSYFLAVQAIAAAYAAATAKTPGAVTPLIEADRVLLPEAGHTPRARRRGRRAR